MRNMQLQMKNSKRSWLEELEWSQTEHEESKNKIEELTPISNVEARFEELSPYIILIDAENLSLDDEFMKHAPMNRRARKIKRLISKAIKKGVKNFYRLRGDVSFTEDGNGICYFPGKSPAVGKSYNWHEKAAKEFMPERNSRLGTKLEYAAFLGVLIKKLIEEGESAKWAWNAVCCDSSELGNYKDGTWWRPEKTGSREFCGFCDLANMFKILAWDDNIGCFWQVSGHWNFEGEIWPIASFFRRVGNSEKDIELKGSVGWVVFS